MPPPGRGRGGRSRTCWPPVGAEQTRRDLLVEIYAAKTSAIDRFDAETPAGIFIRQPLRLAVSAFRVVEPGLLPAMGEQLFRRTRRNPAPARELRMLEGAEARRLATPFGTLPLWLWGDRRSRVLLVHGSEGRGSQLAPFARPLLVAGFRVATWDAPGHGGAPGRSSSPVTMAQALVEVAEACGPLAGIMAHSVGAVAATYAVARGLRVERLVYVAPGADLVAYSPRSVAALGLSGDLRRRLQMRIERRIGVPWAELEPLQRAPELDVPLLAFCDRDDRESPLPSVDALVRAWPDTELAAPPGSGTTGSSARRPSSRALTKS